MENINPSKNITRRGRYYLSLGCLAFFAGAIAIALGVLFVFVPLWDSFAFELFEIFLFMVGLVAIAVGIAGIVRSMTLLPDNRYTYLRNVSKRGVGYIDAVLVGPPGALIFRVVDESGTWINERAEWRVKTKKGSLRLAKLNPTREAVRDVIALRRFLAKHGLEKVPVYAIVVFTSPNVKLSAEGPVVPISEIPTLFQIMRRDYLTDERIAPPAIRATVDAIIDG
jgi:hypothetical protein